VRDQRLIPLAHRVPVDAVHAGFEEVVAFLAPDFVENFRPFLLRNAVHKKVGGGDGFGIGFAFGLGIVEFEVVFGAREDFLAIVGNDEGTQALGESGLLAVLEGKKDQSGRRVGVSAVKRSASTTVN